MRIIKVLNRPLVPMFIYTSFTSIVVESHIYGVFCIFIILYQTVIYPLSWKNIVIVHESQESYYHRISGPPKSWNIITSNSNPIWCKPVSSRIRVVRISVVSRPVSVTDEGSVISGANITDYNVTMIRNNFITQTEIDSCR